MKMDVEIEALEVLKVHPLRNFCIFHLLAANQNPEIVVSGGSVFIREIEQDGSGFVAISAANEAEASQLAGLVTRQDKSFYLVGDWAFPIISSGRHVSWHLDCHQLHLPPEVELPPDPPFVVDIGVEHAATIHTHYEHDSVVPLEYVQERLTDGPAVGIFEDENLVAWAMTHHEMTMGFLYVLPEVRRRGYAANLSTTLSRRMRQRGILPTIHVVKTNLPSLTLSKKMGFVMGANVHWFGLE